MKLIIDKEDLSIAVQAVQRAVSFKSPLPVLSGIKFSASTDDLSGRPLLVLCATDLEMGIEYTLAADIIEQGSIVLPARYIIELIRRLPDIPVTLEALDNGVILRYNQSQTFLNSFPANEFPSITFESRNPVAVIEDSLIFKEAIRQVTFAIARDENRPLFNGVSFAVRENELQMAATDTHRMAWRRVNIETSFPAPEAGTEGTLNNDEKFYTEEASGFIRKAYSREGPDLSGKSDINTIIPGKALNELAKIINLKEQAVKISLAHNTATFSLDDVCLTTRLLQGQYPDYQALIPSQWETRARIHTKKLTFSIERASLLTSDSTPILMVSINENNVIIESNSQAGYIYEEVPATVEGPPVKTVFNAHYLSDILRVIGSEEIYIEITNPLAPALIKPCDQEDYLTLLMPVRIKED